MYHCKSCRQEFEYEESPFDLKCKLNPDLEKKETWDNNDWKRPIGICGCGGEIEVGALPSFVNLGTNDTPRYSVTLGVSETQIAEAVKLHPQAEWKKFGHSYRPLIKNRADKVLLMKQAGYVEYDPAEFRDRKGNS